jgi:GNAT superfamily N-acetyltransferase
MAVEIVEYDPTLRSKIIGVQQYLWGQDLAANAAYFDWKYERNPYLTSEFVRVAVADGDVVGMRGIWGSRWEAGDPAVSAVVPCAGDLVIAPEHRRRGLSVALIEAPMADLRAAGYDHVFNLSGSLPTAIGSLKSGWRSPGALGTASRAPAGPSVRQRLRARARRVRIARRASERLGLLRHPREGPPGRPFATLDRRRSSSSERIVLERGPRPDAMADLVERIGHDGRLRHVRDSTFFAWRFDNPLHAYRFLFLGEERLDAYLVVETDGRGGTPIVNIIDWEGTSLAAKAEVLHSAIGRGAFPVLAIWTVNLPTDAVRLLEEAGFAIERAPRSIGSAYRAAEGRTQVLVKSLRDDWSIGGRGLLDLQHWDLRMLYSDYF